MKASLSNALTDKDPAENGRAEKNEKKATSSSRSRRPSSKPAFSSDSTVDSITLAKDHIADRRVAPVPSTHGKTDDAECVDPENQGNSNDGGDFPSEGCSRKGRQRTSHRSLGPGRNSEANASTSNHGSSSSGRRKPRSRSASRRVLNTSNSARRGLAMPSVPLVPSPQELQQQEQQLRRVEGNVPNMAPATPGGRRLSHHQQFVLARAATSVALRRCLEAKVKAPSLEKDFESSPAFHDANNASMDDIFADQIKCSKKKIRSGRRKASHMHNSSDDFDFNAQFSSDESDDFPKQPQTPSRRSGSARISDNSFSEWTFERKNHSDEATAATEAPQDSFEASFCLDEAFLASPRRTVPSTPRSRPQFSDFGNHSDNVFPPASPSLFATPRRKLNNSWTATNPILETPQAFSRPSRAPIFPDDPDGRYSQLAESLALKHAKARTMAQLNNAPFKEYTCPTTRLNRSNASLQPLGPANFSPRRSVTRSASASGAFGGAPTLSHFDGSFSGSRTPPVVRSSGDLFRSSFNSQLPESPTLDFDDCDDSSDPAADTFDQFQEDPFSATKHPVDWVESSEFQGSFTDLAVRNL
jgi:hypothetical protein